MSEDRELPPGWASAPLAKWITPKRIRFMPSDSPAAHFVGLEHVEAHTMRLLGTVPASTMKSPAAKFDAGDVLYGRLRPYLNKVNRPGFPGLCSGEFIVLPDTPHLRSAFLQYRLNATDLVSFASHLDEGDRPRVDFDQLGKFVIDVPPEREQQRIVAKIEELFSDLDAGVAALGRVRTSLKRYRAAVLKAAVSGKLTEAWRRAHPPAEPADKLLARILAERRRKWEQAQLRKFKEAGKTPPKDWREKYSEPPVRSEHDESSLPASWCWATIDQLTAGDRTSAYGVLQPGTDVPDGVPLVRVCDVADGRVAIDQLKRIARAISGRFERTILRGGEVLLTIVGSIGRTAVAPDSLTGANTARAIAVIPTTSVLSPRFVEMMLRESSMRARLTEAAHEVARKTLNLEDVRIASVPLAPIDEQERIIAEVERRLSVVDAIESEVEHGLKRAARLRQAILKRAFEGNLVAQDAGDEPASVLLERIEGIAVEQKPVVKTVRRPAPKIETAVKPKRRKGINFFRGAIMSYAINALADSPDFGRTQLEKVLHITQTHLDIDMEFTFKREAAGPFDKEIYKVESLAKKQQWFYVKDRPLFGGKQYVPGAAIAGRCSAAATILGAKRQAMDQLLGYIGKMNTEKAELFATTYAAWNDRLIDGRPATDDDIVRDVHAWHQSKQRFTPARIKDWIAWMRKHGYVPKGQGKRTQP